MAVKNNDALYYFRQGTSTRAYDYLGCNLVRRGGSFTYSFRTWAPNAIKVELISEFTGWDTPVPMNKIDEGGVWELIYKSDVSLEKMPYKYRITSISGTVNKGDPYALFSRGLDDGASLVYTERRFDWTDKGWLKHRKNSVREKDGFYLSSPINIYEIHLGSFMRKDDGSYLSYRELADVIGPYVKAMGYTHVELLPIMEHPFDGSWGYQVCGFFAPTSRYGDPLDFKYFVNTLHSVGVGVILDWVPAHFPKDEWGLYNFDGSALYEYQGLDRQESRSWGTRFFDLGREEVQSFLVSSALYFLREFHIDGLRVDAVASMLYLDYDRDDGEWVPNVYGTNINLEAEAFLRKLNTAVFGEFSDVLMIAEESASYGKVTKPVFDGGLGFNMKWNMGFANDFYDYIGTDPIYRRYKHQALTFPIMYAFGENYCLPISHDEVVHGKKSFIDKMFGSYADKFSEMRTSLMLYATYPGKKLTFMGTEYAQFREWDYENSLEWFMLDYPNHRDMQNYVRELNHFYLANKELWEVDFDYRGFEWILVNEDEKNSVAFKRIGKDGDALTVLLNFSADEQTLSLPLSADFHGLELRFATHPGLYPDFISKEKTGDECPLTVKLPAFSGAIFKEKKIYRKIKI